MINSAYIRPDLILNNHGNLGVYLDAGIPTLPYGRFVHDGVDNGYYFQCRSVLVRTPGNPAPLIQYKRFYYVPCFYAPPVSTSCDNLRDRASLPQNSSSSHSSSAEGAASEHSQPMFSTASPVIPAACPAAQGANEASQKDQAVPSSLSSVIEKTEIAATAANVVSAKVDGPITDDEEVGYVGGMSATTLLSSEVIEMVAQQVQGKPKAWANPKITLQSLSPLITKKSETTRRQVSQESKTKSFVEPVPEKSAVEGKKTSNLSLEFI